MTLKPLPIGISDFRTLRENNYCYVDKTSFIEKLLTNARAYFLSRPRRFGKSMLIDTIGELFLGSKELFEGLWIYDKWDWSNRHPVIRIDFGKGTIHSKAELNDKVHAFLERASEEYDVPLRNKEISTAFAFLLSDIHAKTGKRVVVLVDEYDKPILDNLSNQAISHELRDGLRNIYSILKSEQAHLRFVMLTGVSKFAKVSIFSGFNNPNDISLTPRFGNICGYTQHDLETVFAAHLHDVDLDEVRKWYNGYQFLADPIYNPFDVLLFLDSKQYRNYWFETGTPSSLIDFIQNKDVSLPYLDCAYSVEELINKFDIDHLRIEGFLFQSGYLTIKEKSPNLDGSYAYILGFPNLEVKKSLATLFLHRKTPYPIDTRQNTQLQQAIITGNPSLFESPLKRFFASIPSDWYRRNNIDQYEGFYSSVVYALFASMGVHVQVEEATNHGRVDMAFTYKQNTFIFEFKTDKAKEQPIEQILERGYPQKYTTPGQSIWLIGIIFDRTKRNISQFLVQKHE